MKRRDDDVTHCHKIHTTMYHNTMVYLNDAVNDMLANNRAFLQKTHGNENKSTTSTACAMGISDKTSKLPATSVNTQILEREKERGGEPYETLNLSISLHEV